MLSGGEEDTWVYSSDGVFESRECLVYSDTAPKYNKGDKIGLGILANENRRSMFITRNRAKINIPNSWRRLPNDLLPVIGIRGGGTSLLTNLSAEPKWEWLFLESQVRGITGRLG